MQNRFGEPQKQDKSTEFSGLLVIQKDMKDIFRKLQRQDIKFKNQLQQNHTRFFNRFYKQKRSLLLEGAPNTAAGRTNDFISIFQREIKKNKQELHAFLEARKKGFGKEPASGGAGPVQAEDQLTSTNPVKYKQDQKSPRSKSYTA